LHVLPTYLHMKQTRYNSAVYRIITCRYLPK